VLGDPEQLPPVRGEGFFTSAAPDFYLSEVLRQALDSPILSLATRVREGEPLTGHQDASVAELLQVDQVLCGRNVTRWDLISRMRAAQGFPPGFPVPGDRIMCLANNRALGVFNGQQFDVLHNLGQDGNQRAWKLVLRDDDGEQLEISADWGGFTGQEGQDLAKRNARFSGRIALMTFAQAITVHKSQGSEWPSVALLDEGYVFHRGDPDTPRRWTYTGITRAAERLHVIGAVR
jgi:exodeoxyribonuclease-5